MVKYLRFKPVESYSTNKRRATMMIALLVLFVVPSLFSAGSMVKDNNFRRNVNTFISANRSFSGTYIYDYTVEGQKVTIYTAGDALSEGEKVLLKASASAFHINPDNLTIKESSFGARNAEILETELKNIYEHANEGIAQRDEKIRQLEQDIDELRSHIKEQIDTTDTRNEKIIEENGAL